MWGGTGSEVMPRIAAPMVGGMITALVLSLLVGVPIIIRALASDPVVLRRSDTEPVQ
jgi:Cu/Ag efflux pump CusA